MGVIGTEDEELVQARRQGGTVVMSLKQFVKEGRYYLVKKQDDGSIIMREAEIKAKQ